MIILNSKLILTLKIFSILILYTSCKTIKFPEFNSADFNGNQISNLNFTKQNTLVILGHLGCPAFMQLLADFQSNRIDSSYQVIVFLENTRQQLIEFNSEEVNIWSSTRKHFQLNQIAGIIIPECTSDNIVEKNGQHIILSQCRKISRKLRTKTSPTSYLVKSDGLIHAKFEGYFMGKGAKERLKEYFTKIGNLKPENINK